jgi:hypothetical protein
MTSTKRTTVIESANSFPMLTSMNRLYFLFAFIVGAVQAAPNIVLIIADDMAWDDSGVYG